MNERQERIYKIIERFDNVTIERLAREVYASPATIRRDLTKMERDGLISRVWGGAILSNKKTLDPPQFIRSNENQQAKRKIVTKALSLIPEGSSLFLPSGTTVKELCSVLVRMNDLTIITNSLDVINTISQTSSFKIFALGGNLYENYDFIGPLTNNYIDGFSADFLLFSCSGITADGFTSNDINRLEIINRMQKNATKTILLCDSSKVGKSCMLKGFDLSKIDYIIMEKAPNDKALLEKIKEKLIIA